MKYEKAYIDGKEVNVVVEIDDDLYEKNLIVDDNNSNLDDTLDLEEKLSQTGKIDINGNE